MSNLPVINARQTISNFLLLSYDCCGAHIKQEFWQLYTQYTVCKVERLVFTIIKQSLLLLLLALTVSTRVNKKRSYLLFSAVRPVSYFRLHTLSDQMPDWPTASEPTRPLDRWTRLTDDETETASATCSCLTIEHSVVHVRQLSAAGRRDGHHLDALLTNS